MSFLFVILVILILYAKTYWYKYLIDDICCRADYLRTHTEELKEKEVKTKFCINQRHWWVTIQSVGIHTISCLIIYNLWGFNASLLFAVFPLNVQGVAWKTGAYLYGTAALMTLITHYFATVVPNGIYFAPVVLFTALHTAVSPLWYPFYALATEGDLRPIVFFIPLVLFLFGPRFRRGISKRVESHHNLNVDEAGKVKIQRLIIIPKVIGWYICKTVWPSRLGFFTDAGGYLHNYRVDKYFWGLSGLCVIFSIFIFLVDPKMALWWILAMGMWNQFVVLGQFTSERYTILANVAWCVILSEFLAPWPIVYTVIATVYFMRSWYYIKIWRNNLSLFVNSADAHPEAPENHNNAGNAFADAGDHMGAIKHFLIALRYGYKNTNIFINLALAYARVAEYSKALFYCHTALQDCPKDKAVELRKMSIDLQNKLTKMDQNKKLFKKIMRD